MRIAVTGKQGQVVTALLERGQATGVDVIAIGRPEMDLTDASGILSALERIQPDVIVSAAAYTAVDKAESEPDIAFAINDTAAGALASAASAMNIPIIHLSTDYVFPGNKTGPYTEEDKTGPPSVYGRSKLAGERSVAAATPNHVILRTAWIYSPYGANFLKTMLRLAEARDTLRVVADQSGQPTNALDIADAVLAVAARLIRDPSEQLRGTFHLSGKGPATWADFAEAIFAGLEQRTGKHVDVERITTADYPTPAARPANSQLSNDKLLQAYGIELPEWRSSMQTVLDRLLEQNKE